MIRVLIAEDEPPIARAAGRMIEEYSSRFSVIGYAINGQIALERMRENPADVVFTDVRMPVMDGLRLASEIGASFPGCVVVILSGYQEFSYARSALRSGVFDYLLKPLNRKDLGAVLEKIEAMFANREDAAQPEVKPAPAERPKGKDVVEDVKDYLQRHYRDDISTGQIAARFGFVPSYLSRLFRGGVGMSPAEYLNSLRVEKAKELLLDDDPPLVRDIAGMVGYGDHLYFSKIFKRFTGYWPTQYRDMHRKEGE